MAEKRRLGEILVADYRIPLSEVDAALGALAGGGTGERLGTMLVRRGVLGERDLVTALGQQFGIPVVIGLPRLTIPDDVLALVPQKMAERKLIIPMELITAPAIEDGGLLLAMADPSDARAIRGMEGLIGLKVYPAITTEEDIRRAFKVFYFRDKTHADPEDITNTFEKMRQRMRTHSSHTGSHSVVSSLSSLSLSLSSISSSFTISSPVSASPNAPVPSDPLIHESTVGG